MACKKNHSKTDKIVKSLPVGQEGTGRHKCASCAYEIGYEHGLQKLENVDVKAVLNNLNESQKGDRRHRSAHAAYSLGYSNGVKDSY